MSDEYYQTLGVSKTASKDEIAAAYRKLARKYHPDLNQGDPKKAKEQFQKVQDAYDILSNDEKRKVYDQFGVSPDQLGNGGGQGPFQWSFGGGQGGRKSNFNFENLDDIMAMFGARGFGGGATSEDFVNAGRYAAKGQDLENTLTIPFVFSITGGKMDVVLQRPEGGEETVSIKIPAGIEDGKKIRLPGLGTRGKNGGKSGNLYLTVHVEDHPYYTRQGNRLYVKLPITLKEAVFGTKVDVPTPTGSVSLSIPPGSTSGTKLRIKNHGINSGDLLVELAVILPKHWTDVEKQLLEKITSEPETLRSELQWK